MSKKILVVDDSETIREQVAQALSAGGFTVVEAVDGVDGAAKLAELDDIALVLCDVHMPRMNGLEMVEYLRERGCANDVPIVMLTTEGSPVLAARARELGATGWIVKPCRADLLLAAARRLVG